MSAIRPPAVSGLFYPAEETACSLAVNRYLQEAEPAAATPRAMVAPHAGYRYSGPIAGTAYQALAATGRAWTRVIVVSPSHTARFRGIAAPAADAFLSPLGSVPVDADAIEDLTRRGLVVVDDGPHEREHGIEVHLPFLQTILHAFTVVPLVTGSTAVKTLAEILDHLLDDPDTLLVISSDLSHYYPYPEAQKLDAEAARCIEALDDHGLKPHHACGQLAVQAGLRAADNRGWSADTLDLRNSGDTAGTRDEVVGYGAFAFV